MSNNPEHDLAVEYLFNHPEVLGIQRTELLSRAMEYSLYLYGQELVVPDLMFDTLTKTYFYEYKSANSKNCMEKGREQVRKMYHWCDVSRYDKPFEIGLIHPKRRGSHRVSFVDLEDLMEEMRIDRE